MPRGEMLARMSSAELTEWIAFYSLEPFGADADYIGHAIVASTVANRHRPKTEKEHKVEEFMPKFEKKRKSVDEMLQIAQAYTIAMGGKDLRDGS